MSCCMRSRSRVMVDLLGTVDGVPGGAPPCCSWWPAHHLAEVRLQITVLTERQPLAFASLPLPLQRFSTKCGMWRSSICGANPRYTVEMGRMSDRPPHIFPAIVHAGTPSILAVLARASWI